MRTRRHTPSAQTWTRARAEGARRGPARARPARPASGARPRWATGAGRPARAAPPPPPQPPRTPPNSPVETPPRESPAERRIEAPRPARPARQDRRGEGDALGPARIVRRAGSSAAHLGPARRHRARARPDHPLRPEPVAHHAPQPGPRPRMRRAPPRGPAPSGGRPPRRPGGRPACWSSRPSPHRSLRRARPGPTPASIRRSPQTAAPQTRPGLSCSRFRPRSAFPRKRLGAFALRGGKKNSIAASPLSAAR